MELLFILLWKMRQDVEFQRTRSTIQALYALHPNEDKNVANAFEDYRKAFFPFSDEKKDDEKKDMQAALMREISKGPIQVSPTGAFNRRKIASGLAKGEKELARHRMLQEIGKLEKIDLLGRAKRKPRA
jgi:hypothetical protein